MIRTYLIPLLAIAGVVFAVISVVKGSRPELAQPPVADPPRAPYAAFVAGSGIVEPSSQNISIGAPVSGVVWAVSARVGGDVKQGEELFRIDDRELRAELASKEAMLAVSTANLEKLRLGTRPEELPRAIARVAEAQFQVEDARSELALWTNVKDPRAVSEDALTRKRFAARSAEMRFEQAKAELALLEAGAWAPDIAIAEADVRAAAAAVEQVKVELERRIVRSPIAGRVLQVNLRVGEYASSGAATSPLMILGAVESLHVRVDVDEHDAWRVKEGSGAVAFVRGNKELSAPLTFVRFEPFVVPKRSLTGESTERVDTRVLQVIYRFDPAALKVFVGQQMDVYIEVMK